MVAGVEEWHVVEAEAAEAKVPEAESDVDEAVKRRMFSRLRTRTLATGAVTFNLTRPKTEAVGNWMAAISDLTLSRLRWKELKDGFRMRYRKLAK